MMYRKEYLQEKVGDYNVEDFKSLDKGFLWKNVVWPLIKPYIKRILLVFVDWLDE